MMKIEYEKKDEAERNCVAFIDGWGDLCIKGKGDLDFIWVTEEEGFYLADNPVNGFSKQAKGASHRFYPGDSITITF